MEISRRALAPFLIFSLSLLSSLAHANSDDPLPSWNDGKVKQNIIAFVERVTTLGSDFVPVPDRIATFDNDGTLWQEKPFAQAAFVLTRLKKMVADDPSLLDKPAVKAAVDGDHAYFHAAGEDALMELVGLTHAGMTDAVFDREARAFFATVKHPALGKLYKHLTYQPMLEVLRYLRANGFKTFISSGGGIDFMRVVTDEIYGIPTEQVIGSSLQKKFIEQDGRHVFMRLAAIDHINDKLGKPIAIDLHIGKRPIFAAGNVRSGGDIAMLTYSKERQGDSLQLMVNHDDVEREFAYSEPDNASLNASAAKGFHVVSMKKDWKTIF